jgi:hypothetical protein
MFSKENFHILMNVCPVIFTVYTAMMLLIQNISHWMLIRWVNDYWKEWGRKQPWSNCW